MTHYQNNFSLEDIQTWSSSMDEETMRMAWKMGVAQKYADTTSEFFMCMMPFNEMAIEWTSAEDMAAMMMMNK